MKVLKTPVIMICLFAISAWFLADFSYAEIPRLINYQGKLTDRDGKPVSDGTYSVTFRIYDQEAGGSPLWFETQSVTTQKGIFSTQIGATKNLNLSFDKPYYLGIKVGSDTEMTPRQRLTSSGYAFEAAHAAVATTLTDKTKLLSSGIIVMWSGNVTDIPEGWVLCDGTNGTPDLRDRFIVGAGSEYSVGTTGGRAMHEFSAPDDHSGTTSIQGVRYYVINGKEFKWNQTTYLDNRPPYYALAYIMKK